MSKTAPDPELDTFLQAVDRVLMQLSRFGEAEGRRPVDPAILRELYLELLQAKQRFQRP